MQKLNIVTLFPGQGSLYNGVGRSLIELNSNYSDYLKAISEITKDLYQQDISVELKNYFDNEINLNDLDFPAKQILIFMVNILVDDYYKCNNIQSHCYVGHSFGEISALTASGHISFSQGIEIICHRTIALLNSDIEGGMGILFCSARKTKSLIDFTEREDLFIANENSLEQTVISGKKPAVEELKKECKKMSVNYLALEASNYPYHSPFLKYVSQDYERRISHIVPKNCESPVFSPITQKFYDFSVQSLSETLANHLIKPVLFAQSVNHLKSLGYNTFIEGGSQKALTNLISRDLGTNDKYLLLQSSIKNEDELTTIKNSVDKLKTTGCNSASLLDSFKNLSNDELLNNTMMHFLELSQRVSLNKSQMINTKPFEELLFSRSFSEPVIPTKEKDLSPNLKKEINEIEIENEVPVEKQTDTTSDKISNNTIEEDIFQLVQELTEYPREVLDSEAEFEADLGIDSVKQWGIISAIKDKFGIENLFEERDPAEYNTIGKIVAILQ